MLVVREYRLPVLAQNHQCIPHRKGECEVLNHDVKEGTPWQIRRQFNVRQEWHAP
jgi:hypothetical protein